jgi:hypothetical protein
LALCRSLINFLLDLLDLVLYFMSGHKILDISLSMDVVQQCMIIKGIDLQFDKEYNTHVAHGSGRSLCRYLQGDDGFQ